MTQLEAIFSDYDGTLCALELRREDAFISPRLRRVLTKASKRVKLGIITTKDLYFIKDRVPFANGYAATSGLELQVGDKITLDERRTRLQPEARENIPRRPQEDPSDPRQHNGGKEGDGGRRPDCFLH